MYDFHYNFFYDFQEVLKHKHLFDFSNKVSKFFDDTNEKFTRKMKDKSEVKLIGTFFGLKSKVYSMKNIDGKESNAA